MPESAIAQEEFKEMLETVVEATVVRKLLQVLGDPNRFAIHRELS